MNYVIKNAIELLVKKLGTRTKADEALKFTQAALNLAHVEATLSTTKLNEKSR